jgi:hypothetical protein
LKQIKGELGFLGTVSFKVVAEINQICRKEFIEKTALCYWIDEYDTVGCS